MVGTRGVHDALEQLVLLFAPTDGPFSGDVVLLFTGVVVIFVLTVAAAESAIGLAILVTVLAFNLLGDGLRDALDPKDR